MPWIDVDERLPPMGKRVPVFGEYTPVDPKTNQVIGGTPYACRRPDRYAKSGWEWSSEQWRGTVAIGFWWEEEPAEAERNVA